MIHYTDPIDPTRRIPFYEREEIERITWDELRATGQATEDPGPVCIETFLMERYGIGLDYVDFPEDICGEAVFSSRGIDAIRIRREFAPPTSRGLYLLGRSTSGHETGHAILHASEIVPEMASGGDAGRLFRHRSRGGDIGPEGSGFSRTSFSRHRALEWQANAAMGGLLMPRPAVMSALGTDTREGVPGAIRRDGFVLWSELLAETFDVSGQLAGYRLLDIFPTLRDLAGRDDALAA
ncbi:MAG: hypothetical protein SFU53_01595 [Terrimicrobiaceae bacterium]|nr:hypothetical protein [Terrimicrobiaceae bacterium]